MSNRQCRWGILGAATIARKNWQSIRDAGNAVLVAVASRDAKRSAQFIAECQQQVPFPQAPAALGSYEELIARPDIDAIYLPIPTGLRKEWAIRAANAGKHVMVEKPVGVTVADVEEILAACQRKGVQFMDGVMFNHGKRLGQLRSVLDDGKSVGEIRRISSQFSFLGSDEFFSGNIRVNAKLEPLGCLGDLGWYNIRFSLWAMQYQMPRRVTGRIDTEARAPDESAGVPTEFSGELLYDGGVSASFHCSFCAQNSQWATVSGTKGYLTVRDFVLPFFGKESTASVTQSEFVVKGCQFDMREGRSDLRYDEPSNNAPGAQEVNLFQAMSGLVLSGKLDPHWPDITLKTQRVLNACLESARTGSAPLTL